ncbi:MAG: cobalamin-binding protein [Promethearchaeota archaeon]|nr:MAG: cobalamin-binding protein [Candidatus Lokiarchaeota archaeon]
MDYEQLTELIVELELDDIADAVREALEEDGKDPFDVLSALTAGMDEVGRRYDDEIYYLADLMLAAETMKVALEVLKPKLASSDKVKEKVKVIIATVKGDNHDIGKNLLGILLMSEGFEVIDLGKDVDEETIVAKVKETGATIVGLSSLLSMTVPQIEVVHEALKKAGLRDKVRLIVGGAPLSMDLAKQFGADDFAEDTIKGINHIKNLAGI